jgi:hypothetical protein
MVQLQAATEAAGATAHVQIAKAPELRETTSDLGTDRIPAVCKACHGRRRRTTIPAPQARSTPRSPHRTKKEKKGSTTNRVSPSQWITGSTKSRPSTSDSAIALCCDSVFLI